MVTFLILNDLLVKRFRANIWSISCLLLAVFPLCEPVGRSPQISLTIITPLIASVCLYYYKIKLSQSSSVVFDYVIVANALTSLAIAYSNFYWSNYVSLSYRILSYIIMVTLNIFSRKHHLKSKLLLGFQLHSIWLFLYLPTIICVIELFCGWLR
jgi:hypothetical protein